jgi:DNA-3-methyladenine glycosylase I
MTTRANNVRRCSWARTDLSIDYHDREWGVPAHDDQTLFEFLILEGAQAGLSWETILRKRVNYRRAFDNFDPSRVAKYGRRQIERLLQDEGIIRNRLKILSAIQNARAFLAVQKEFGSFDKYLWKFIGGKPIRRKRGTAVPVRTELSDALSLDLKRRGFNFVGSTICYSFLQAIGVVNDHDQTCFRHHQVPKK